MELQKNRIAMVSPSQNAYSETFIQEQKKGLRGKVFCYYGGNLPTQLEGVGRLLTRSKKIYYTLLRILRLTDLKSNDLAFYYSLKENKVQVVIAQYGPTSNRILKVCKKANIPLITHFHGYDASVYSVIESNQNYKDVFEYSRFVIAVSKSMFKKLKALGCSKEKLVYNPYGPSNEFLDSQCNFNSETFVGVGRFVNKKAPYLTILSFNKVVQQYPNAQLVLAGSGELLEVCVNLVKQLKIENNVFFPGVINRSQFIDCLQESLAFVQHSVTALNGDQEGTPVAILEASAAGLPVISTHHAGIPDVILDNETGLLVDEHDVESMANAMLILLSDKTLAKRLGENGKKRIKEYFSMGKHISQLDELVAQCCKNE